MGATTEADSSPLLLVVDDDEAFRRFLTDIFRQEGYRIEEACDGEEAIAAFERCDAKLVLLDAMMPLVDGFTACRRIRQLPRGQRVPILILTFLEDDESVARAFAVGATDYIAKPIHTAVLLHRARRLLEAGDAEVRVALTEARMNALVGNALDCILTFDRHGIIDFSNVAAERLLGYPATELTGCSVYEIFDPPPSPSAGASSIREAVGRRQDGKTVDIDLTVSEFLAGNSRRFAAIFRDITGRKRAEAALRQNEARTRALLDAIPDLLYRVGRDGALRDFRPGRGFDLGERETEGHEAGLYALASRVTEIGPALAADGLLYVERALATGADQIFEQGVVVGGETRYYETRYVVSGEDEVLALVRDITARRRAEESLRKSEETQRLLESAVLHSSEAIFILCADEAHPQIVYANPAFSRMSGYDPDEILGSAPWKLPCAASLEFLGAQRPDFWHHVPFHGEAVARRKDGSEVQIEVHVSPIRGETGGIHHWVFIGSDITDRKRQEESLRETQKLESIGLLAGGVAHDFNNLLTVMIGQTSIALAKMQANSASRANVEQALSSARRASDLTNQLLAYAGKGPRQLEYVDLNRLIRENAGLLKTAVPKNVQVDLRLGFELPSIKADRGQIQQVVMNLIINAAEAIPPATSREVPGGTVAVQTGRFSVLAEEPVNCVGDVRLAAGEYVSLEVSDNGVGMDSATVARIFDPFFTTKFTGRGLGLSAVLGIVRSHGGGLQVDSEPDHGSTFRVLFPAEKVRLPGRHVHNGAPDPTPVQPPAKEERKILVIDDEEMLLSFVSDVLAEGGIGVLTASNGREGVDLFVNRRSEIGLVLLDLKMPVMSGEETLRALREVDPEVRVVISSGYNEDEANFPSDVDPHRPGAAPSAFLKKPYEPEALLSVLRSMLAQPR
jgi:PAS domain S-box-containing protein